MEDPKKVGGGSAEKKEPGRISLSGEAILQPTFARKANGISMRGRRNPI